MRILSNTGGLAYTNCYLVIDETTSDCVLFDAPDHTVGPMLDHVDQNKLNLIGLWLTHGHFDHIADHQVVRDRFPNTKVLIHRLDEPKMLRPGSQFFQLPFEIPPGRASAFVEDEQKLAIGKLRVEVLFTPGHSPGHVSYWFPEEKVLVGGDLIIGGAVGRTDLPDSREEDLIDSVRRVMKLPAETKLLPGHGEPDTLADELRVNDYVRAMIGAR